MIRAKVAAEGLGLGSDEGNCYGLRERDRMG